MTAIIIIMKIIIIDCNYYREEQERKQNERYADCGVGRRFV